MASAVLARKWRPKYFADLVGQDSTVTILRNILQTNRLHHAYLLTGTRGVGKTTIARIIAKAFNCQNLENGEPCSKCESCLEIERGSFIDVIEIDAASNTGVDNIREVIENSRYAPTSGKYKIYIIDEVHMLSKPAFNAMLKTLEEPPEHIIFILATTDPQKIPITVLSRCLQLKLRNLLPSEIAKHLAFVLEQEQVGFEASALDLIANSAAGSMRDALSLTDQAIAYTNSHVNLDLTEKMLGLSSDKTILAILQALVDNDANSLVVLARNVVLDGVNILSLLEQLRAAFVEISIGQLTGTLSKAYLATFLDKLSVQDTQLYFEITNIAIENMAKVTDHASILIMSLLRMCAFKIGAAQERNIIVQSNNFVSIVSNVAATEPASIVIEPTPEVIAIEEQPQAKLESPAKPIKLELETLASDIEKIEPVVEYIEDIEEELPPFDLSDSSEIIEEHPVEVIESASLKSTQVEFDGDWYSLVRQISTIENINPSIITILNNSSLLKYTDGIFSIEVAQNNRILVSPIVVDEIDVILANLITDFMEIEFNFSEENIVTVNTQKQAQIEVDFSSAKQALLNDPIIQDMQSNYGATIVEKSIVLI